MKIRTIPQEYEAIIFNGITKEVEDFIYNSDAKIHKQGDDFVLSNFTGNHGIHLGDILYVTERPLNMIQVAHRDNFGIFNTYFEVIE